MMQMSTSCVKVKVMSSTYRLMGVVCVPVVTKSTVQLCYNVMNFNFK